MNEQEALLRLQDTEYECMLSTIHYYTDKDIPMLQIAIKALEEIKQYRALDDKLQCEIGITLKELYEEWNTMLAEYLEYQRLGTVEELREAREKQIVKKPIRLDLCTCPRCGTYNETVNKRRNTVNQDIVYCWHCGQAMEITRLE